MRLSGDQIYLAFPSLALLALAAVLPPILHSSTYLFLWETWEANAPPVTYAIMISTCVVSALLVLYLLKLTCRDAEVRILTPPEQNDEDDGKWAKRKETAPQQPMESNRVVPIGPGGFPTSGGMQQQQPQGGYFPGTFPGMMQPQGGYYPGSSGGGAFFPTGPSNQGMMMAGPSYGGGAYYGQPTAALAASSRVFERRAGVGSPARSPMMQPLPLMDADPDPAPLPGGTLAPPPEAARKPTSAGWNRIPPPKPPGAPRPPAPPPLPPPIGLPLGEPLGEGVVESARRSSSPRKPVSPLGSMGRRTSSGSGPPPWAQESDYDHVGEIQVTDEDDDLPVRRDFSVELRLT